MLCLYSVASVFSAGLFQNGVCIYTDRKNDDFRNVVLCTAGHVCSTRIPAMSYYVLFDKREEKKIEFSLVSGRRERKICIEIYRRSRLFVVRLLYSNARTLFQYGNRCTVTCTPHARFRVELIKSVGGGEGETRVLIYGPIVRRKVRRTG